MTQPSKEQIRKWQQERIKSNEPPPDPIRIRQELGWVLVESQERNTDKRPAFRCHP